MTGLEELPQNATIRVILPVIVVSIHTSPVTAQPVAHPFAPTQAMNRPHGTDFDPAQVGRDAGLIAGEVVTYLVGLSGSRVSETLKFESNSGFETE